MSSRLDPVTIELIRYGLDSIVDEMAVVVARTSRSATIRDALDYSTGLCDAAGEVIAQGLGITLHLGSFGAAVRSVLDRYRAEMHRGDVFVLNDPYLAGGIHLPDIYLIKPIFRARSLVGFAAVVAHHSDVGGAVPSSNSTNTSEIYQEGLRIPCLKLRDRGHTNPAIWELIRANVRVPDDVSADLAAQLAAVGAGETGLLALIARYGRRTVEQATVELLNQTELAARLAIRELPKGVFQFTTHIDRAGAVARPVTIRVKLTLGDDDIRADFAGTSDSVEAGINCPLPFTESAVYAAVRLVLDREMPSNGGFFRAIDVVAPLGCVINPRPPAACGARGITGFRVMEAVLGALGRAAPERVPADGEGGNTLISIGGQDQDGHPFIYTELFAGSRGGSARGDGPAGVPHPGSNNANMPIEVAEARYPLRFREYGLVAGSFGEGVHRGAPAIAREFTYLGPPAILQLRSDKRRFPPYGSAGGRPGQPSLNILNPGTPRQRVLPTMGPVRINTGDIFRHVLASGGGWGDPEGRPRSAVEADIETGLLASAVQGDEALNDPSGSD